MQNVLKFNKFLFTALMGISLSANAEYTVKYFVEGIKVTGATTPAAPSAILDGDTYLTFSYDKKIINNGESFELNILSSTFECFDVKDSNSVNWDTIRTSCAGSAGLPYVTTINSLTDLVEYNGSLRLEIIGYNQGSPWDDRSYPFSVALNDGIQTPVIGGFGLSMDTPAQGLGFVSPFYGDSYMYENYYDITVEKAKEYKLDIPSTGFSTGWLDIRYYSTVMELYHQQGILESPLGGNQEVSLSARNGSNIVSMNKNIALAPSGINPVLFNLCNPAATTCSGNAKTITTGGTGYVGSLTFKANNTKCMSIQSNEDPAYAVAVNKCHTDGAGGAGEEAIFAVNYPNHDSVGQTAKVYNYNYKATGSDRYSSPEVVNGVFTVTISY